MVKTVTLACSIGVDFGTNSVRPLLVDVVCRYPRCGDTCHVCSKDVPQGWPGEMRTVVSCR